MLIFWRNFPLKIGLNSSHARQNMTSKHHRQRRFVDMAIIKFANIFYTLGWERSIMSKTFAISDELYFKARLMKNFFYSLSKLQSWLSLKKDVEKFNVNTWEWFKFWYTSSRLFLKCVVKKINVHLMRNDLTRYLHPYICFSMFTLKDNRIRWWGVESLEIKEVLW